VQAVSVLNGVEW